jgi:hypothetical protein
MRIDWKGLKALHIKEMKDIGQLEWFKNLIAQTTDKYSGKYIGYYVNRKDNVCMVYFDKCVKYYKFDFTAKIDTEHLKIFKEHKIYK